MYNHQIYASGVYGVLKAHWKFRCETPLAIRNGLSISHIDGSQNKNRGVGQRFMWRPPNDNDDSESKVAALHYGYKVVNNNVEAYHFVPPSSVRGALRSWTINHLILPSYRTNIAPPEKKEESETKNYTAKIQQALADPKSGYQLIASLFGQAFDTRDDIENLSNAGRLKIETTWFSTAKAQPISVNGILEDDGLVGPINANRQMTVRNPLDRITHASKEGGLHHFLEFCKGETFEVNMTVVNPQSSDLGLLSLWQREINDGLLRFGALSSIGRGRVSIQESDHKIQLNPSKKPEWMPEQLKPYIDISNPNVDALSSLWDTYRLDSSLDHFIPYLEIEARGNNVQS